MSLPRLRLYWKDWAWGIKRSRVPLYDGGCYRSLVVDLGPLEISWTRLS